MIASFENYVADKGKIFVMTAKGMERTPPEIRHERQIGKPVFPDYDTKVPKRWVDNGWVEEVDEPK